SRRTKYAGKPISKRRNSSGRMRGPQVSLGASTEGGARPGAAEPVSGATADAAGGARAGGAQGGSPTLAGFLGVNVSMAMRVTPATMATSAMLKVGQWSEGRGDMRPLSHFTQPAR